MKKIIAIIVLTSLLLTGCNAKEESDSSSDSSSTSPVVSEIVSSDISSKESSSGEPVAAQPESSKSTSSEAITATAPSKPQSEPKQAQESTPQKPSVEKVKLQIVDVNGLPVICARAALSKEPFESYMEQEQFTAYETDSNGFIAISYKGAYSFNVDNGSYYLYVEQQNVNGWGLERVEVEISDNSKTTIITLETGRTWESNLDAEGRVEVKTVDSSGNAVADITVIVSFTGIGPAISGPYSEFAFKTNSDGKTIFFEKGEGKHKAVAYKNGKQVASLGFSRETKEATTVITLTV